MNGAMKSLMPQGGIDEVLAVVNGHLAMAGLSIARDEALMLAERRAESLAEVERVEFGQPAVPAIAEALANSPFLVRGSVADVLDARMDAALDMWREIIAAMPPIRNVVLRDTLESLGELRRLYDTRFAAHEVPCDIDYQLSKPVGPQLMGLDYIEAWLAQLLVETRWIAQFDVENCIVVLERACPDYKGLHVNLYDLLFPHESELGSFRIRA